MTHDAHTPRRREMVPRGREMAAHARPPRRLLAEWVALYIVAPVVIATLLPPGAMFAALFTFTAIAALLLARTPGFRWRELGEGKVNWREVVLFGLLVALVGTGVMLWLRPDAFLSLPRRAPGLWLMVLALYPLLSALPQELVFRVLFFRRYGALFASKQAAILANAACFSLAHLIYWNIPALALTFAGGIVFAHAWLRRGFRQAFLLHAVAGQILFTLGMGVFFYSGAVTRPW